MSHETFTPFDYDAMKLALNEAQIAFEKDEVPVGAALFLNNQLIATGHNLVHTTKDATMHAEIVCLRRGAQTIGDFRLQDSILYSTLEPCSMCAGAIYNFRVKKVIWGAKDLRVGACGTLYHLFDGKHPIHTVAFQSGLMQEQSAALLRKFFKKRRENGSKNI
jgi:tRNA(adenine34) deaminase